MKEIEGGISVLKIKTMRIFKNFILGAIAFVMLAIVISFFLPDRYRSKQSIHIDAPIGIVFNQVNDLKNWKNWSYFHTLDENWNLTFGKWHKGRDASFRWESQKVEDGELSIIESIRNEKIAVTFDYYGNGQDGEAHYFFKELEDGTEATFELEFPVELNPIAKFENLWRKEDNANKPQFNYSLRHLKGVSEKKFRDQLKN